MSETRTFDVPTALLPSLDSLRAGQPGAWQEVVFDDLRAVGDWIDRLDAAGITDREVVVVDMSTFIVRWRI